MIKVILIFMLVCGIANAAKLEDQSPPLDNPDSEKLPTVVLKPKIYISDATLDTYNINLDLLFPYLERVIIVENPELKRPSRQLTNQSAQTIEVTKDLGINYKSSRYILSFSNHSVTMGGSNEQVFVSGIANDKHLTYFLVKPNFSYYHPVSKEYLGTEILIIGKGTVLNRGNPSLLRIDSAKEPIKLGTLLLPTRSLNLPNNLKAFYSEDEVEGYILSVIPGLTYAANNNIVIISLGARDKIKVGQLLNISRTHFLAKDPYNYNKSHLIKPAQPKGQLVIYEVFKKLSLGLVLKMDEEIKLMDKVVSS